LPRLSARIDAKPCFRMIQNSGRSGSCWPAVVHCTSPAHALACAVWPHNHAHLSTPNATPRHTVPTLSQAQSHPLSTYHTPTHTCTCARAQTRCRGDRYAALLGSARCVCVCVCACAGTSAWSAPRARSDVASNSTHQTCVHPHPCLRCSCPRHLPRDSVAAVALFD
jgi:hypothetical protein